MHEALNNWGAALSDQAKTKTRRRGPDALFQAAGEKYAAALSDQARQARGAQQLGQHASRIRERRRRPATRPTRCLAKPPARSTRRRWRGQARRARGAQQLGQHAVEDQAKTKTGDAADALFHQPPRREVRGGAERSSPTGTRRSTTGAPRYFLRRGGIPVRRLRRCLTRPKTSFDKPKRSRQVAAPTTLRALPRGAAGKTSAGGGWSSRSRAWNASRSGTFGSRYRS